ncbi:MAG: 2-amino-4-hydroxy-6-hydroxymethyldihydropteridine diphosphokinase [Clostridia bacterium]|nr:2-amino-4-hydroxy-6-hydroxymethyldihydropteridine diphosphokinase [Clostridia bacterium]
MKKVVLGLGTNIGDRLRHLNDAVTALSLLPHTEIDAVSAVYETAPWGYTAQENFYNICVSVNTDLSPNALLGACLGIEAALGRVRTFQYAPRVIDIDVLLYEGVTLQTEELTVPHKEMLNRAFVLYPLAELEIAQYFSIDIEKAKAAVSDQKIIRTNETISCVSCRNDGDIL